MAASQTTDPVQGFDVEVYSVPHRALGATVDPSTGQQNNSQLQGVFTSLMFKVVNQTETYLPLNSRIPRHLDGEIIFVWAAEQGLVTANFMVNTFGKAFADGLAKGRGNKIPRSDRFALVFRINTAEEFSGQPATFDNDIFRAGVQKFFTLEYCRVDTYSFGVTSGRHVVANSWQGTAEKLRETNSSATANTVGQ